MTLEEEANKALNKWSIDDLKKSGKDTKLNEIADFEKLSSIADFITGKWKFKTLTDTKEILFYKDGVYCEMGDVLIAMECEKMVPNCSNRKVNEITGIIQRRTYKNRDLFNTDLTRLILENGILDLKTFELTKHTPDFLSTIKIPVIYDPKARCQKFIKFLKDCLVTSEDIITVIEEISNILTTNQKNFEVISMWIGRGANGKSSTLKIINTIIGPENCSNISIHDLQEQRFTLALLYGKLANIHADISSEELKKMGLINQLVSGEPIHADKKFQGPFSLINFSKMFFSANEMPNIRDNSDGSFRRIYVTKWEKQFIKNRIDDIDKIILEDEKSGIFNLILENYKTLLRNKGFRYKQNLEDVRETIKNESDKMRDFVIRHIIEKPNSYIVKGKLYNFYVKYCKVIKCEQFSKPAFGNRFPKYLGTQDGSKKINGKTERVWLNVAFNSESQFVKDNVEGLEVYV